MCVLDTVVMSAAAQIFIDVVNFHRVSDNKGGVQPSFNMLERVAVFNLPLEK